jgi:hypothetical protein
MVRKTLKISKFAPQDDDSRREVEWIRCVRNNLVHGVEIPSTW